MYRDVSYPFVEKSEFCQKRHLRGFVPTATKCSELPMLSSDLYNSPFINITYQLYLASSSSFSLTSFTPIYHAAVCHVVTHDQSIYVYDTIFVFTISLSC